MAVTALSEDLGSKKRNRTEDVSQDTGELGQEFDFFAAFEFGWVWIGGVIYHVDVQQEGGRRVQERDMAFGWKNMSCLSLCRRRPELPAFSSRGGVGWVWAAPHVLCGLHQTRSEGPATWGSLLDRNGRRDGNLPMLWT